MDRPWWQWELWRYLRSMRIVQVIFSEDDELITPLEALDRWEAANRRETDPELH